MLAVNVSCATQPGGTAGQGYRDKRGPRSCGLARPTAVMGIDGVDILPEPRSPLSDVTSGLRPDTLHLLDALGGYLLLADSAGRKASRKTNARKVIFLAFPGKGTEVHE